MCLFPANRKTRPVFECKPGVCEITSLASGAILCVTHETIVVFNYIFVKFGTFTGAHVVGSIIIIMNIITMVLQPSSDNDASLFHTVFCLGFPFVNSTFLKVFLNAVHPSHRGRPTFLVPSVFVNVICGGRIVSL